MNERNSYANRRNNQQQSDKYSTGDRSAAATPFAFNALIEWIKYNRKHRSPAQGREEGFEYKVREVEE